MDEILYDKAPEVFRWICACCDQCV